jgi:hypothetical protein
VVYHLGSNLGRVQGRVINLIVHVHFLMPLPAGIAAKARVAESWFSVKLGAQASCLQKIL